MLIRFGRRLGVMGLLVFTLVLVVAVDAYAGTGRKGSVAGLGLSALPGPTGADTTIVPFLGARPSLATVPLSRDHEGAFGSFSGESPEALTVDQATGDVYVLDMTGKRLLRYSADGSPVDFSAGPNPGTNEISGLSFEQFAGFDQVAVDSSTGPAKGDIYITESGAGRVSVFAANGESLGALTGSGTPAKSFGEVCGVAVDQSDGDVYIASWANRVWRYSPSGSTVVETDYSGGIQTSINPCGLAVADGHLFAKGWQESPFVGAGAVEEYSTSEFASTPPVAVATQIAPVASAVAADPASGDVYVDERSQVTVYDQTGTPLYSFGSESEIGTGSRGVAVSSGGRAYVSDQNSNEVHIYGPTLRPGGRADLGSFGSFDGESPQALTVDQATGDVYVLDLAGKRLLRFSASGLPADFSAGPNPGTNEIGGLSFQQFAAFDQVAVDSSSGPAKGDIYVTESGSGQVSVFASTGESLGTLTGSGTPAKSFGEVCGVAVDQSNGEVYVASWANHVWRYSPSGSTVVEVDYSGGIQTSINPCGLAVADGRLYAKSWQESPFVGAGVLEEYPTSAFEASPTTPSGTQIAAKATAVATDPSNGDVYVDEGEQATVYNTTGNALYSFAEGEIGSTSAGIAIAASGDAYLSDHTNHQVHIYGPFSTPAPIVQTKPATDVKHVTATLQGHLDSNNGLPITSCTFEWGTSTSYSETPVPCSQDGPYTGPSDVTAELTGLTPNTIYHYRLHITTTEKVYNGEDENLETVQVPGVHVLAATFGGSGSGDGQLSGNTGLAVDQETGDVYVADTANHRIEKFDASGNFISTTGWGVTDGKPELQTCTSNCQAGIEGSGQGQLAKPEFIAVDNSGGPSSDDVYVGDTTNNTVTKYNSNGNYIETNNGSGSGSTFGPLAGITIDDNGNLWVYDTNSRMREFAQNGNFTTEWKALYAPAPVGIAIDSTKTFYMDYRSSQIERWTSSGTELNELTAQASETNPYLTGAITGLAIDPRNDDLYADDGGKTILQYKNPSTCVEGSYGCVPSESFGEGNLSAASGLASDGASGRVYVSDSDSVKIFVLGPAPEVVNGPISVLSSTSVLLKGTVEPNGVALTDCHFEYVSDAAFSRSGFADLSSGGTAPCSPDAGSIVADFEDHTVTATISGLDPTTVYRYRLVAGNINTTVNGQDGIVPGVPLVETTGSPVRTAHTSRLDSRINPHGLPTTYHFEYTTEADYNANGYNGADTTQDVPLINDETQLVRIHFPPGPFKIGFSGESTGAINPEATAAEIQAALRALPNIGSPNVTVISAGEPGDSLAYQVTFTGALANTDVPQLTLSNAGSTSSVETTVNGGLRETVYLVSATLQNLEPATTYRYRVVADNGTPGGPTYGTDQSVTTRGSDAPLTHGSFAGPPGSDRAWEQVSTPDTDGNSVKLTLGISNSGERAIYEIEGGTPSSTYGGATFGESDEQLAERTSSGWRDESLFPTRAQAPGNLWEGPWGSTELTELYAANRDETNSGNTEIFRLKPGVPAEQIFSTPVERFLPTTESWFSASENGSQMIVGLPGTYDPAYPIEAGKEELYDLSSGTPKMVGLLPGNTVPACGVEGDYMKHGGGGTASAEPHWLTPDGSHLFFNAPTGSGCNVDATSLYDRDLANGTTTLIAPDARFIRSAAGAVFFDTSENLEPGDPPGTDIYRYQIDDHTMRCLTCSIGVPVDMETDSNQSNDFNVAAVSSDGSRVYFVSEHRLLSGAAARGIYRLDVANDDLAYVAPAPLGQNISADPQLGDALSPDGSFFAFRSSDPELNAVGGQQNGGMAQYYLYNDNDRSLACVSCPPDGSLPRGEVPTALSDHYANGSPLSENGDFAFATPTPLVSADENTAAVGQEASRGTDIYEWRDGQLLLVTDGKTETKKGAVPEITGMAADGRDIFFTQLAALTPDAIDTSRHLYDARIGGGFDFPQPPPPCSLEACQGNAAPPPDDGTPASLSFSGPGNQANSPVASTKCVAGKCGNSQLRKRCAKGKVLKHGKCVKQKPKRKRKRAKKASHHKGGAK